MLYVWVFAGSVFVGGLVLLALLTVRAFRQVKHLGRTVAAASTRIGDETATIEALAPRDRADRPDRPDRTDRTDRGERSAHSGGRRGERR